MQAEKINMEEKIEEKRKLEEEDLARLTKEKESHDLEFFCPSMQIF